MFTRKHVGLFLLILMLLTLNCSLPWFSPPAPTPTMPALPSPSPTPLDPQAAALQRLEEDSLKAVDLDFRHGFPTYVNGLFSVKGVDPVTRAENFLELYRDLYRQNDPDLTLAVKRLAGQDKQNVVFFQSYKGVPIVGSEIVVYQEGEQITTTVGALMTNLEMDITPTIPAQKAEEILRKDLGFPSGEQVTVESRLMVYDRSLFGEGDPDPHLVWRIMFGGMVPIEGFVDAHDGEIIETIPRRHSDIHTIPFTIRDYLGFPSGDAYCYDQTISPAYYVADDGYFNPLYAMDDDAVMGRDYILDTYNFYMNSFGHRSFDGADLMEVPIILNVSWPGAWYYPECCIIELSDGWVGDDVMTHEYTHGVLEATSGLHYTSQAGALNESYADIMGAILDDDWTMAEGRTGFVDPIRDLANPPAYGQPDHLSGYIAGEDPHFNNGIPNKVAYLVAEGGTHYGTTITGIGESKMGALYFSTMTSLPSSADFMAARNATFSLAETWAASSTNSFTDFDVCQVRNAFHSVGLGLGDENCDGIPEYPLISETFFTEIYEFLRGEDGDYIEPAIDNCILDFNILQLDTDGDGIGDVCDDDDDDDGIPDEEDNCHLIPNPEQTDSDGDGIGDACEDDDDDGIFNKFDLCINTTNPFQLDHDNDKKGDACDTDDDDDGIPDDRDNCPLVPNKDQRDSDGDGIGDACDNCPKLAEEDQSDTDGDSQGDACDKDDDNDGINDTQDNCPFLRNPSQLDWDKDGKGTPCDEEDHDSSLKANKLCAEITRSEDNTLSIPLPTCLPDCLDLQQTDFGIQVFISGMPETVKAWITDSKGTRIASAKPDQELRLLTFQPIGGEGYFLRFAFAADIPEGEIFDICLELKAGQLLVLGKETSAPSEQEEVQKGPCTFTSKVNLFCREGPGRSLYPDLDALTPGQSGEVVAYCSQGYHVYIIGPNTGQVCAVPFDEKYGELTGNCEGLPLYTPPPHNPPEADETEPPPQIVTTEAPQLQGCMVPVQGGFKCVAPCPNTIKQPTPCTP